MEFNIEVYKQLYSLFQKHDFKILEQEKNNIKFKSPHLIIILTFNPFEKLCYLNLVNTISNSTIIEINNEVLREFFKTTLNLEEKETKEFILKVKKFFKGPGKKIIEGDPNEISKIEKYSILKDKEYTNKFE